MVPAENLGVKNAAWDRADKLFVPRDCYNSYFFRVEDPAVNVLDKLKLHGRAFTRYLDGGSACHINLDEHLTKEQYRLLLDAAIQTGCNYFTFNIPNTLCKTCGYISKHRLNKCPRCGGEDLDYATRIIGYLKLVSRFAAERQAEEQQAPLRQRIGGRQTVKRTCRQPGRHVRPQPEKAHPAATTASAPASWRKSPTTNAPAATSGRARAVTADSMSPLRTVKAMLICVDCGSLFEQARTIVERHGLDTPPYEELRACPRCWSTAICPDLTAAISAASGSPAATSKRWTATASATSAIPDRMSANTESPLKYVEAAVTLAEVPEGDQPDDLHLQLPFPLPRLPLAVSAKGYWQAAAARSRRAHRPLCRADHLRLPDGRRPQLSRVAKRAPAYPGARPENLPLLGL